MAETFLLSLSLFQQILHPHIHPVGPAEANHVRFVPRRAGRAPILNPGRLPPAARDSACIQCHLEGNATVYKPGRSLAQFRPGDTLSDFAMYFVRAIRRCGR